MSNSKYNVQKKITDQMLKGIATQDIFFTFADHMSMQRIHFKRSLCKIIIRYVKLLLEMKEKYN